MLWMIAKERRQRIINNEAPEVAAIQINLPGFEGLPQTIFLRNGRRQRLDYANAAQISEHIAMLKARMERSPKIAQFQAVLKIMRKYTDEQPDIQMGGCQTARTGSGRRRSVSDHPTHRCGSFRTTVTFSARIGIPF